MQRYVEITFDCLPLRTISRLDIPIDASPRYQARCERIKAAIETHGSHNTFYLYNANCVFRLTNAPDIGMLDFTFEGTVMTDENDEQAIHAHLDIALTRETCDWLTEPAVAWFKETVPHAVREFDRYIAAGDLEQAKRRVEAMQAKADQTGGYMGMYLQRIHGMDNFHAIANWIEAGVWTVVAILLAARAIRSTGRVRRILGILSAAFLLFGVSDVIEAHTGAWWRPLGLLLLKAFCLALIACGFWAYFKFARLLKP